MHATASAVIVRIYALIICNFERNEVLGSSAKWKVEIWQVSLTQDVALIMQKARDVIEQKKITK